MPQSERLDTQLNYRELADRHDFRTLHAFHAEYLRQLDVAMRHKKGKAEIDRIHGLADTYQQAIEYKEVEGL